jgi:hypothetical protein
MRLHLVNDGYAILENGLCLWSGQWSDRPDYISNDLLSIVEKEGWIDILLPAKNRMFFLNVLQDWWTLSLERDDVTVDILWMGLFEDRPSYLAHFGEDEIAREGSIDIELPQYFDLYRLEGDYGTDLHDDIPYILDCFGYDQYFICEDTGYIWVVLDIAHIGEMLELIDGRIWRSKWSLNFVPVPVILGGVQ